MVKPLSRVDTPAVLSRRQIRSERRSSMYSKHIAQKGYEARQIRLQVVPPIPTIDKIVGYLSSISAPFRRQCVNKVPHAVHVRHSSLVSMRPQALKLHQELAHAMAIALPVSIVLSQNGLSRRIRSKLLPRRISRASHLHTYTSMRSAHSYITDSRIPKREAEYRSGNQDIKAGTRH